MHYSNVISIRIEPTCGISLLRQLYHRCYDLWKEVTKMIFFGPNYLSLKNLGIHCSISIEGRKFIS